MLMAAWALDFMVPGTSGADCNIVPGGTFGQAALMHAPAAATTKVERNEV
jgi:hypothetical protein